MIFITNTDFEALVKMKKKFSSPNIIRIPARRGEEAKGIRVDSIYAKESFLFDADCGGKIELRYKTQLRHKKGFAIPMVRFEVNAPPHTNPDGRILSRNHVHIYKEGYGDLRSLPWAYEYDEIFKGIEIPNDPYDLFDLFCEYCSIDISRIGHSQLSYL